MSAGCVAVCRRGADAVGSVRGLTLKFFLVGLLCPSRGRHCRARRARRRCVVHGAGGATDAAGGASTRPERPLTPPALSYFAGSQANRRMFYLSFPRSMTGSVFRGGKAFIIRFLLGVSFPGFSENSLLLAGRFASSLPQSILLYSAVRLRAKA